jgi:hypothetical protein
MRKIRRKKNRKEKRRKKKEGRDISLSYSRYTTGRSCFAKRFFKTVSASPENLLHQHSHSRSYHSMKLGMYQLSQSMQKVRVSLSRYTSEALRFLQMLMVLEVPGTNKATSW